METKIVQVVHGRQKHHIALYGGMAADELCTLLRSMYRLPAAVQVVGLSSRAGDALVVPLALACAAPQSLASPNGYQLLLAGDQALLLQQQQEEEEEETEEEVADEEEEDEDEEEEEDEDEEEEEGEVDELALEEEEYDRDMVGAQAPAAAAAAGADGSAVNQEDFSKLIRFFQILRQRRMISKASADTLEELLFENNSLLRAAYEVAAVAGDAGYLAVLCRDIAANKQTADGQAVCAAQEDLLLVCDMFRQEGHISEGQLFNLRHLILVRDEAMVNIYDSYQMTQDARSLMVSLLHMAQKYPVDGGVESAVAATTAPPASTATAGTSSAEAPPSRSRKQHHGSQRRHETTQRSSGVRTRRPQPPVPAAGEQTTQAVPRQQQSTGSMDRGLARLVGSMERRGQLSNLEAELLRRLISDENEYVVAAYEVFEIDGDETELRDTLTRLARIFVKRIREQQDRDTFEVAPTTTDSSSARATSLPQPPTQRMRPGGAAQRARTTPQPQQKVPEDDTTMTTMDLEADPRARGIMQRSVTELIEALGVENQWNNSVAASFLLIVWSAVKAGVLTKEEATYLCNLYASDDDMVNAAWQVYRVHPDERDVIDTLIRISRSQRSAPAAVTVQQEPQSEQDAREQALSRLHASQDRAVSSAADAALDKAHLELLSQALQFMIKQDMIGIDPAKELLMRAARGDAVVRGATECFMADKNVAEYLDTLHIIGDQIARDMGQPPTEEQSRNAATVSAIAASSASALGVGGGNADDDDADADDDGVGSSDVAGSSNNGGDGAGTDPTVVQQRLQAVANQLYKDGQINDVENTTLLQLIADRDDRIMAAYDVFTKFNDMADFVDSLLRIVKREAVVRTRAMSTERDEEGIELLSMSREGGEDHIAGERQAAHVGAGSVLGSEHLLQVIDMLVQAGNVAQSTKPALDNMARTKDWRLVKCFNDYESHSSVETLIVSINALVGGVSSGSVDASRSRFANAGSGNDSEDDDGDDDEEEEVEDVGATTASTDEMKLIEERFFQVVAAMRLTDLEMAALRLAIIRQDNSVRAALDVYRLENNEADLQDTLRRIAAHTIRERMAERSDGTEDDNNNDDQRANGTQLKDDSSTSRNGGANSDSRSEFFTTLMNRMVGNDMLANDAADKLTRLFEQEDDVVLAALDTYDVDHDIGDLVDTLQRLART